MRKLYGLKPNVYDSDGVESAEQQRGIGEGVAHTEYVLSCMHQYMHIWKEVDSDGDWQQHWETQRVRRRYTHDSCFNTYIQ